MAADGFAQGELEDGKHQWNDAQHGQHPARNGRVEQALHRYAHDDGEVDAPYINAEVGLRLEQTHHGGPEPAGEQGAAERDDEHHEHLSEHHQEGHEEGDVGVFLHHGEEKGDDDGRDGVGKKQVYRQRRYASAQLFDDDGGRGGRRADDADEDTFEQQLHGGVGSEVDEQHGRQGEQHANALEDEVPAARAHVVHPHLAERDVEHEEDIDGQDGHQKWADELADGCQWRDFDEQQVDDRAHRKAHEQRPSLEKLHEIHHQNLFDRRRSLRDCRGVGVTGRRDQSTLTTAKVVKNRE